MDQREHDVEEDLKHILRTRLALTEKIQSLEQRVKDTVWGTKEIAMEAVDDAKNQTLRWVTSATDRLSSFEMLGRRPPIIAGGVVAMGLLAIWMSQRKQHGRSGVYPYYPPQVEGVEVMPEGEGSRQRNGKLRFNGNPPSNLDRENNRQASHEDNSTWLPRQLSEFLHGMSGELIRERAHLQKAALHIGRSFVRDMVHIAGQSLVSFIDQVRTGSRGQSRQNQPRGR